jgi:hypothetical protein
VIFHLNCACLEVFWQYIMFLTWKKKFLDHTGKKQLLQISNTECCFNIYCKLFNIDILVSIHDHITLNRTFWREKNNFTSHIDKKIFWHFVDTLSLYIFTIWKSIVYNLFCRDGICRRLYVKHAYLTCTGRWQSISDRSSLTTVYSIS